MPHPLLYELNTRCWLRELSETHGAKITLANVPDGEFERWRTLGFTHIWTMGAWTTGPRCRERAFNSTGLRSIIAKIPGDWRDEDIVASPYAIADYQVASDLGGEAGLAIFREKLHAHELKLLLDFVPNHLGLDHSWVINQPRMFVHGETEFPGAFRQETAEGALWLAHGRDPYFPPWDDTVQLDYRRPETRAAMMEILRSVSQRCDGVRCDMAMLLLNDVFAKTWERVPIAVTPSTSEFWADAISTVKRDHPDFLFLAEAYWDLEARLQSLGFDYTYHKTVRDLLVERSSAPLRQQLLDADPEYLARSAHFLENHDEPRAAAILTAPEHCAAALLTLGLPGMRFLHEGQLRGARIQIPVQLARWPVEPPNPEIAAIYEQLLATLKNSPVGAGEWKIPPPQGWPDNSTAQNIIAVHWWNSPSEFDLVAVNLASDSSQCRLTLEVPDLANFNWQMRNRLGDEIYQRAGLDLVANGLHLELPPHGAQLFHFTIHG